MAQFATTPHATKLAVFGVGVLGALKVGSQTGAKASVIAGAVPVLVQVLELVTE